MDVSDERPLIPETRRGKRRIGLALLVALSVVGAAVLGIWVYIATAPGSLRVSTTTPYVAAGDSVPFHAVASTPPTVGLGLVTWQFGDGSTESSGVQVGHVYPFPGDFFVGVSSHLTNGGEADNFQALFPMQAGPPRGTPNPLGTTGGSGVLSVNTSASSPGAPLVPVGGTIQFEGDIGQPPTFFYATEPDPGNDTWVNFTWQPVRMTLDFGDGSPPQSTSDMAGPFVVRHTYRDEGIHAATLTVTTANVSAVQSHGLPAQPTPAPVVPAQSETTSTGQSVAVGAYRLVTYAGGLVNPGVLVDLRQASGGYLTLDPAVEYYGDQTIPNVYESLLEFNGSRTDSLLPVVADAIPTRANGGISPDGRNYTFHVRPGLAFSDGTPVTAWAVKYSFTRTLLFTYGAPPTPGHIFAEYLLPTNPDGTWDLSYRSVNDAITVDNATQHVTFHLVTPTAPLVLYQTLATYFGTAIVSPTWLESVGPKLTWSDAGFLAYQAYGVAPNYVSAWENGAVGSGPYLIDYTANPEAVVLKANPTFVPVPGVPRPQVPRVVIEYVASESTRELALQTGQADIAGIDTSHFEAALGLQQAGLVRILFTPTLGISFWVFNMEIAGSSVGPNNNPYGNHVPQDFFVDANMRKAFFYAFDFDQYRDDILGNRLYNATFGIKFRGFIPQGMIGSEDLSPYLVFDMQKAHDFYNRTQWVTDHGWANSGFTLAITVDSADPIDADAAAAWAKNLDTLAPGITVNVVSTESTELAGDAVPHANPIAIFAGGWSPDYPFPTGMTVSLLLPGTAASPFGGAFPGFDGFNISYFANDKNGTNQVANMTRMLDWIDDSVGANATDVNRSILDSQRAQEMAMNLTMYVPTIQQYSFFTYRTWIAGMEQETNPILGGVAILYNLLMKPNPSPSAQAASTGGSLEHALRTPAGMVFATGLAPLQAQALRGLERGWSRRRIARRGPERPGGGAISRSVFRPATPR